jgi:hypothetical protein
MICSSEMRSRWSRRSSKRSASLIQPSLTDWLAYRLNQRQNKTKVALFSQTP